MLCRFGFRSPCFFSLAVKRKKRLNRGGGFVQRSFRFVALPDKRFFGFRRSPKHLGYGDCFTDTVGYFRARKPQLCFQRVKRIQPLLLFTFQLQQCLPCLLCLLSCIKNFIAVFCKLYLGVACGFKLETGVDQLFPQSIYFVGLLLNLRVKLSGGLQVLLYGGVVFARIKKHVIQVLVRCGKLFVKCALFSTFLKLPHRAGKVAGVVTKIFLKLFVQFATSFPHPSLHAVQLLSSRYFTVPKQLCVAKHCCRQLFFCRHRSSKLLLRLVKLLDQRLQLFAERCFQFRHSLTHLGKITLRLVECAGFCRRIFGRHCFEVF